MRSLAVGMGIGILIGAVLTIFAAKRWRKDLPRIDPERVHDLHLIPPDPSEVRVIRTERKLTTHRS